jgi:cation transport protein ChaC
MPSPTWIFGYGSLIWRPSFPFEERRVASIEGWARRFWQGSTDHRGVPGAPGRVVTLVGEACAVCRGVAYRIADGLRDEVLAHLDHREKGGYARHEVELHFDGAREPAFGVVYVATDANPEYLGAAPFDTIAAQIRAASGPSGSNAEYVLRLAEALRAIDAYDDHVFSIAAEMGEGPTVGRA